jgi:hypothetical protein
MDQFLVVTTAALAQRLIRGRASLVVMAGVHPGAYVRSWGKSGQILKGGECLLMIQSGQGQHNFAVMDHCTSPPFGLVLKCCAKDICPYGSATCAALVYARSTFFVAGPREIDMEQILINLVAGAIGGVGVAKSSPTFDLGMAGNIISGLIGGGVLGQIVTLLLPSVVAAAQSGNLSVGGIVSQVIAGGAGGAILTALIGAIKNKAAA